MKTVTIQYVFLFSLLLSFYLHGEEYDGYTLYTPMSAQEDIVSTYLIKSTASKYSFAEYFIPLLIADCISFESLFFDFL